MRPVVSIKQVSKHYPMGRSVVQAVRSVDLELRSGEFITLAGASGCGKTTLLNLIGCMDTPTAGAIFIDGQNVSSLSERQRTQVRLNKIGFVFQSFNLLPALTAYENVELPLLLRRQHTRKERTSLVNQILDRVGLGSFARFHPNELSGGQQQRVAVARALVGSPTIVLADEPTANLDSRTGRDLLSLMRDLNHTIGTTFLLSSHDQTVLSQSERIIKIVDGEIAGTS